MNPGFLIIGLICLSGLACAQSSNDTMMIGNEKLYMGRKMDSSLKAAFFLKEQINSAKFVGRKFLPFRSRALHGKPFTQDSLLGKITFILFWFPRCDCYNPEKLKSLYSHFWEKKDFQILVISGDTTGFVEYSRHHNLYFNYNYLPSLEEAKKLSFGNPVPAFMLVNKAGVVVRVSGAFTDYNGRPYRNFIEQWLDRQ